MSKKQEEVQKTMKELGTFTTQELADKAGVSYPLASKVCREQAHLSGKRGKTRVYTVEQDSSQEEKQRQGTKKKQPRKQRKQQNQTKENEQQPKKKPSKKKRHQKKQSDKKDAFKREMKKKYKTLSLRKQELMQVENAKKTRVVDDGDKTNPDPQRRQGKHIRYRYVWDNFFKSEISQYVNEYVYFDENQSAMIRTGMYTGEGVNKTILQNWKDQYLKDTEALDNIE